MNFRSSKPSCVRRINFRANNPVPAIRVIFSKRFQICQIKTLGVDFAFNGIHTLPAALQNEIYFAAAFVSLKVDKTCSLTCTERIQHKVLPKPAAIFFLLYYEVIFTI